MQITRAPRHLAERWLEFVEYDVAPPRPVEPEWPTWYETVLTDRFTDPPAWALDERGINKDVADELSIRWAPEDACWILPIRHPGDFHLAGWQTKSQVRKYVNTLEGTPKSQTLWASSCWSTTPRRSSPRTPWTRRS